VLSIGANIAEGDGRRAPRDKAPYYTISKSSGDELNHYLFIAEDLGYAPRDPGILELLLSVSAMLVRLTQKTLTDFPSR